MEAKDTVKEWSQEFEEALVDELCREYRWEEDEDRDNAYKTIAILKQLIETKIEAQAEISFKAGIREVIESLDIDLILNMLKQGKGHIWQKRGRQACGEQIEKLEVLKKEANDG